MFIFFIVFLFVRHAGSVQRSRRIRTSEWRAIFFNASFNAICIGRHPAKFNEFADLSSPSREAPDDMATERLRLYVYC